MSDKILEKLIIEDLKINGKQKLYGQVWGLSNPIIRNEKKYQSVFLLTDWMSDDDDAVVVVLACITTGSANNLASAEALVEEDDDIILLNDKGFSKTLIIKPRIEGLINIKELKSFMGFVESREALLHAYFKVGEMEYSPEEIKGILWGEDFLL